MPGNGGLDALTNHANARLNSALEKAGADVRREALTPKSQRDPQQARKTAEDFEAVFLTTMISQMFKGLKTDGMFQGGFGEKVWREHMIAEWGKQIAASGGVGIADSVYDEIMKAGGMSAKEAMEIVEARLQARAEGAPDPQFPDKGATPEHPEAPESFAAETARAAPPARQPQTEAHPVADGARAPAAGVGAAAGAGAPLSAPRVPQGPLDGGLAEVFSTDLEQRRGAAQSQSQGLQMAAAPHRSTAGPGRDIDSAFLALGDRAAPTAPQATAAYRRYGR